MGDGPRAISQHGRRGLQGGLAFTRLSKVKLCSAVQSPIALAMLCIANAIGDGNEVASWPWFVDRVVCGPKGLGYEPWARKPSVSSLRCWPKGQPTHVSKGQRPLLARGPDLLCKSGLGSIGLQGQCIEWVGAFGPNQCVGCSLQGRARRALTCEQLLMHCLGPMGLKAHWGYDLRA